VADVFTETFPPFDHQAAIVGPYEKDRTRDSEFRDELASKLFTLVFKIHAWSSSRPTQQNEHEASFLEKDLNDVFAIEQEQDRTRERLRGYVASIKLALAALISL